MIVDAHTHIFPGIQGLVAAGPTRDLGYGRVAAGAGKVQHVLPPFNERTAYTPEMLIATMDWAGVEKAVLLQGPFYGECNAYVADAVRRHPDRLVGAGFFDPWTPGARQVFEALFDSSPLQVLKLECSESAGLMGLHPDARLDDPDVAWLWDELERRRLVLTLDVGHVGGRAYQTGALRQMALAHPNLSIVIPHLAGATPAIDRDTDLKSLWEEQIDLGHLPNVWFDTAALPFYLPDEDYPYPTAERYLRLVVDRIGPGKVMWGTDIPALLACVTYPQLVRMAQMHTSFLGQQDQELVLGRNAAKVYGC